MCILLLAQSRPVPSTGRTNTQTSFFLQPHPHPPLLDTQCYIIYIMGCVKSKKSDPTQNANSVERVDGKVGMRGGERAVLVDSETTPAQDSPRVNPVLLDYAQRLSEEIVARAVQQWAEVDSRYSDIPYIECDVP